MQKKSRFKTKLYIFLIILAIFFGFFIGYKVFKAPKNQKNKTWVVPNSKSSKKILTKDVIIKNIKTKNEFITLEIELKEPVTIDDSWGSLDIFKKIQNINFYASGIFTTNLSNINKQDIKINNFKQELYIKVPKPHVKSVTINEEKTEYQTPENGIFRFGQIKLNPEEYQLILSEAKKKMNTKLNESNFYSKVEQESKKSINELLIKLLSSSSNIKNYKINIEFK